MSGEVRVELCRGDALAACLPALAQLRLTVFRDWPYLYDGTAEYEAAYLRTYAAAGDAAVAVAWDGDTPVGASTCLPMTLAQQEVRRAIEAAGWDCADFFYFGESVLLPAYRGRGTGVRFFTLREAQAVACGRARWATFCAVQRAADHPLRPGDAAGLDQFWAHRGYTRLPAVRCQMAWKDVGEAHDTDKTLGFWVKALRGAGLPGAMA